MKITGRIPLALLTAIALNGIVSIARAATGTLNDYNPYNYTIPDNGASTNSDLLLSGAPSDAKITKAQIYYEIKHPRPSDLDVWLTCWNNGWQGDYFLHYQGDSSSVDRITVDNIHTWDGKTPNVTWYLATRDRVSGQIGYIDFVELWVTYSYNVAPNAPNNEDPTDGTSNVSGSLGSVCHMSHVSAKAFWSQRLGSGLAASGLEVRDRVAGLLFALAQVGEQFVYAVTARGGQRILGTPHFPRHQVAFHRRLGLLGSFTHKAK